MTVTLLLSEGYRPSPTNPTSERCRGGYSSRPIQTYSSSSDGLYLQHSNKSRQLRHQTTAKYRLEALFLSFVEVIRHAQLKKKKKKKPRTGSQHTRGINISCLAWDYMKSQLRGRVLNNQMTNEISGSLFPVGDFHLW